MVIEGETVGVRTDGLGMRGIVARLANIRVVVVASTAVARCVGGRTRTVARIENGPLDVVVWVGVDAVARLLRREHLQVPGAPSSYALVGLRLVVRNGKAGVGVGRPRPFGRVQVTGRPYASGIDQVGWDAGGVGTGMVDQADRQIVPIDE